MRPTLREQVVRIPGHPEQSRRPILEWVCRDCDYFEEEGTG